VLVADFAIAAIARANPDLRDRAFALVRMPTTGRRACQPHSELSHVSPAARVAGVRPAMTVAQARALIPDLIVQCSSPAAERSAADALLDMAESVSPVVEEGKPGCVWLDLTGVEHLYGFSTEESAANLEASIAQELIRRAHQIGLEAAAGIAANKEIAYLAARCGGARVIAAGMEREFLDWMPLDLLELDPNGRGEEVELMLKRLGIRRLGDLARLDSRQLGSRLGRYGVQLARLARGEGSATVMARPRTENFVEVAEFDYAIDQLEPLGFVLHGMLKQLTTRLQMRGLAAGDLILTLELADRRHDHHRVPVSAATLEARSLLMLLKLHLAQSPPPAAVEAIRLTVEARARHPAQNDLFLPPLPAPDRLETAIARITALCGPGCVGTLVPADSYRPEAVRLTTFAPPPPSSAAASTATKKVSNREVHNTTPSSAAPMEEEIKKEAVGRPNDYDRTPIVLRAIRPAEEVEVICIRNSPEFVRGAGICARVVSAAGPWRRQGEWWAVQSSADSAMPNNASIAYQRDYYELALADGAVYRIYLDLSSGRWFVDGIYD
jgi:nucleotidyltransferase/DNA polymerase involved in DNA repair